MQEGNENIPTDKLNACAHYVNRSTLNKLDNEQLQRFVHLPHPNSNFI